MKRFYSLGLVVTSKDEQILPYLKLFRYLEILFSEVSPQLQENIEVYISITL